MLVSLGPAYHALFFFFEMRFKCTNKSVTKFTLSRNAVTSKRRLDPVWQTVGFLSRPIMSLVSRRDHLL